MFLSTRNLEDGIYKCIALSAKKNAEKHYNNKKLDFTFFKISKFPSIYYILVFIFLILSGKIFSKERANIKYKNIEIGRFILAETFKSYKVYLSDIYFYIMFIKNFLIAGRLIKSADNYNSKNKIKAIYIDHCGYINGILYSYFSKQKTIVYTNNFPKNIYGVDFRSKKNLNNQKYENSLKIKKKNKLNNHQIKKTKMLMNKLFTKPNIIPWMQTTKYQKYDGINYDNLDYIVYAHSFTDGQLWFGYDDFENTLDWLLFTLNRLEKLNKKVLVKGHPNFYNKVYGINSIWDNKIFSSVKKKYKNNRNFYFIDRPLLNHDILKKVNKNTILLSHHGTVLLEAAYHGFKSICSKASFFDENFNMANIWNNKKDYEKILNQEYSKLKLPNKNDAVYLVHKIFLDDRSYSGKKFWNNIIVNEIGISMQEFQKKIEILPNAKNKKKRLAYFKKLLGKKEGNIILKISKNIELL